MSNKIETTVKESGRKISKVENQDLRKNNEDRIISDGYGIGRVIENQQYIHNNIVIKNLMEKYSANNVSLRFKLEIDRKIENNILSYLQKIGSILIFDEYDRTLLGSFDKHYIFESEKYNCFGRITYAIHALSITLSIFIYGGEYNNITSLKKEIEFIFKSFLAKENNSLIEINYYLLSQENTPIYLSITEQIETEIQEVNYPFIANINKLIENYFNSKASILFLIGNPGTGKTRFIRYLLSRNSKKNSVYYTSDRHVIEHGSIFTDFLQSSSNILVLEDFDFHLNSRKEGNTIMYHLLGLSDGLIQSFNKKIIISTNLSSLNNIDEAIIRKGRCFDIINFRFLYWDEVVEFFKNNNCEEMTKGIDEKEYTLADLYYILNNKTNKKLEIKYKKAGFN